jgi:hypothetical protein
MYSVVMVVAMAGAPEAPACCPTFHCPKICLPQIHCPTFHMPKLCCKPVCHTSNACCAPAPCAVPAPVVVAAPVAAPCAAPCAPACDTHCAPKGHGCCFLSKCFSFCGKGGYGGGWGGGYDGGYAAPAYAGPVGAPGCGQTIIPPQGGVVVPQGTVYPQGTVVVPQGTTTTTPPVKKEMPKTGPTPKTGN